MSTCKIESTIEFLGRKHMLKVLKLLLDNEKPQRYKEFRKQLKINSKTLTDRLRELEEAGIVTRINYGEIPPRVEYFLTEIGLDMEPLMKALDNFDIKHVQKIK